MDKIEYLKEIKSLQDENVIYGLVDPDTNEIRYIGKAINLYERIRNHYKPSRLVAKTHKNNWLNKLLTENKYVKIIIIEKCKTSLSLNETEIKWIQYYKEKGNDLTNGTEGGDGGKMSQESIDKMRATKIGKKLSEEHKTKISNANKGHYVSEETREVLREKRKNYTVSDNTRIKMSESKKGNISWNKGKTPSLETKEKMRLARLNYLAKINNQ